jgi:hypothetical protein
MGAHVIVGTSSSQHEFAHSLLMQAHTHIRFDELHSERKHYTQLSGRYTPAVSPPALALPIRDGRVKKHDSFRSLFSTPIHTPAVTPLPSDSERENDNDKSSLGEKASTFHHNAVVQFVLTTVEDSTTTHKPEMHMSQIGDCVLRRFPGMHKEVCTVWCDVVCSMPSTLTHTLVHSHSHSHPHSHSYVSIHSQNRLASINRALFRVGNFAMIGRNGHERVRQHDREWSELTQFMVNLSHGEMKGVPSGVYNVV